MAENRNGISRREALKRMGAMAVGVVATSMGILPAMTSCDNMSKKSRIILYFTATGNSLYVARELTDSNEQLLSIPQMVKVGRYDFEADEIGVVYPIYGHMPPNTVREFIKRANLKANYKFAILTYGNIKSSASEIWNNLTRSIGKPFDYIATIIMVDNWLPHFDMNEQMKIDKHIPENLQRISADLAQRKQWCEPVSKAERTLHDNWLKEVGMNPDIGFLKRSEIYFDITASCIGCGICNDVCPRGNYKFTSNGIQTEGDCDFCFACIQNCPQKAIRFKKIENDPQLANDELNPNARYRNEHISLMDIKRANRQ